MPLSEEAQINIAGARREITVKEQEGSAAKKCRVKKAAKE